MRGGVHARSLFHLPLDFKVLTLPQRLLPRKEVRGRPGEKGGVKYTATEGVLHGSQGPVSSPAFIVNQELTCHFFGRESQTVCTVKGARRG